MPTTAYVFNGLEKSTNIQRKKSAKCEQYTYSKFLTFWWVNPRLREYRNDTSKDSKINNFFLNRALRPLRYDANSGTPHSAIFQDKSIKKNLSYPGALYSAVERMADWSSPGQRWFVHGALRDSVLTAGRHMFQLRFCAANFLALLNLLKGKV